MLYPILVTTAVFKPLSLGSWQMGVSEGVVRITDFVQALCMGQFWVRITDLFSVCDFLCVGI